MKFIGKSLLYIFLASTLLLSGYQIMKYVRDTVRVANINTINSALQMYHIKNGNYPLSDERNPITTLLKEKNYIDKEIHDPVAQNSSAIMDEYAGFLLGAFAKFSEYASPDMTETMRELEKESKVQKNPEYILVYFSDGKEYELSTKLESPFSQERLIQDNGNDDKRYEVGTQTSSIDTSLSEFLGTVKSKNSQAILIP